MARREGLGLRLVSSPAPIPEELLGPVVDERKPVPPPVDDATFAGYTRLFEYDPAPLHAKTEEVDDSHAAWRKERVSFDAAYAGERVPAYLFLPKGVRPPYQTVIFFPGADATMFPSSREMWLRMVEFFVRSGRAVVYPVYQGTYERKVDRDLGPIGIRDLRVQRANDVRRTVDYLETRSDVDGKKIAYYGLSLGAMIAPLPLALDGRFRTAILFSIGLAPTIAPPEVQIQNFLPRVTLPTLLIGGRYDFDFPVETSQRPFFDLLGTPADRKKHVVFEGGHLPTEFNDSIREMLAWTDRWLGPVG
jgi:dipeptidyl aminopeptidase/acylaminoacyl peptidase